MLVTAIVFDFFFMPIKEVGTFIYHFISFNFSFIFYEFGLIKSVLSTTFIYITYEAILASVKFFFADKMSVRTMSYNDKANCIETYFNFKTLNESIDNDYKAIINDFKLYSQRHNIEETKLLLFKKEYKILSKLLDSKTGKDILNA